MLARRPCALVCCTLLAALAAPAGAKEPPSAAREFPLKYRLTVNIAEETGCRAQDLTPTAERPALKAEPRYHSREPLYATFRVGVGKEAVTAVLDSSGGGNSGYDLLYVDADRDRRITAGEKVEPVPGGRGGTFGPVKIQVDCGGERCPQWFLFQYSETDYNKGYDGPAIEARRSLTVINAGYYQGVVTFGSRKCLLAVVDHNANGLYNDLMQGDERGGDRLLIDLDGDGKLDAGYQSDEAQPLGRHVLVGDRYWRLDVAPDGSAVTVAPLDRPLGTVRGGPADFTLMLAGEDGVLRVTSKNGSARVPAGKYRLTRCRYRVADGDGKPWEFTAWTPNRGGATVDVPAGGTATVPFGPPLVPKVEVMSSGAELNLSLSLRGAGGEVYSDVHLPGNQKPPVPRARVLDASGRELAVFDFHYG